jgi:hypothetical protein
MKVQVIKSTTVGIHLSIDDKEFGFNKATGVFKAKQADGKWAVVSPTHLVRNICIDRQKSAAESIERSRSVSAFYAKNPTYQTSRQRYATAVGNVRDYN